MMKRFVDKPRYIFDTGIWWKEKNETCVVCPKCEEMGIVKFEDGQFIFICHHCSQKKVQPRLIHIHKIEEQCSHCERFFRVEIPKEKHQFKVLNVNCPHCDTLNSGKVQKSNKPWYDRTHYQKPATDIIFGYPLYFLDYLDNKPIWALNREHLQYLIDYIEADLRESPREGRIPYSVKGHSYQLPKFMKLAKNRDKVLKILRQLQVK